MAGRRSEAGAGPAAEPRESPSTPRGHSYVDVEANEDEHLGASGPASNDSTAVGVITLKIKMKKMPQYERWDAKISAAVKAAEGFLRRDRQDIPIDGKSIGVSLLLYFESQGALQLWESSSERSGLVIEADRLGLFEERRVEMKGMGLPYAELSRFESSCAKSPKVLPPPKWKLWLIIWFCVFTVNIAFNEAGVYKAFTHDGWIEYEPAILLMLFIKVSFITYAYSPFIIDLQLRGYGVGTWLKMPRLKMSSVQGKNWFHARILAAGLLEVMQNGFSLFNPPPPPPMHPDAAKRIAMLEYRLEAFKRHLKKQSNSRGQPSMSAVSNALSQRMRESIIDATDDVLEGLQHSKGESDEISVTINHRVKWECLEEFAEWQHRIIEVMSTRNGYLSSRLMKPKTWDDNLYTIIFRFKTLETLSEWMHSEERIRLLGEVQHLLETPDVVTASKYRQLPDVFTDQLVPQGRNAARRPPPKWKTVVLTVISLFLTVWPLQVNMPRHLKRWGVSNEKTAILVLTGFVTLINMYLTAPFVTNLFGYWLRLPKPEHYQFNPWKLIDIGLTSKLSMAAITFVFFLGCGLKARDT